MRIDELKRTLPPCCEISTVPVGIYPHEAREMIIPFMPDVKTIVVLGHHVQASLEWAWFPFPAERGGNTCAADLHARSMIESVGRILESHKKKIAILPYPDACGISFKRLAAGTNLGELGDSFLFLHREWGPWVHLRVLLTDAEVVHQDGVDVPVCTHCGRCAEACPGRTLYEDHHDQQACGRYQQSERERLNIRAKYRHKCEVCARVCPVGEQPIEVMIRDKEGNG